MTTQKISYKIDTNRAWRMIRAWIDQKSAEQVAELRRMAEKYDEGSEEAENALARFLVHGYCRPSWSCSDEGNGTFHWNDALRQCREATANVELKPGYDHALLERLAAVGRWPNSIPEYASEMKEEHRELLQYQYRAAWVRAWLRSQSVVENILAGGYKLPSWSPSHMSNGYVIAEALVDAIGAGLIVIPDDKKIDFLLSYAQWYGRNECGQGNEEALAWQGFHWHRETYAKMPVADLQLLAFYVGQAALELGKRRIPLNCPRLQNTVRWMEGYRSTRPVWSSTIEQGAGRFYKSTNAFEMAELWAMYADVREINWADPFGDPVESFSRLVGLTRQEIARPTYEDAVVYMQAQKAAQKKQRRNRRRNRISAKTK